MDKCEQLKKAFPEVAQNYRDTFDFDKWLEFEVSRSVESIRSGAKDSPVLRQPGPITYVQASPNNGTQYRFHIIFSTMGDEKVVDGIPENAMLIAMDPNHYAWRRTCYLRELDVHPSYLMEKLGMGEPDAVAMSLILYRVYEMNG